MRTQQAKTVSQFDQDNPGREYMTEVRLSVGLRNDRMWNTEAVLEALQQAIARNPWKDTYITRKDGWHPGPPRSVDVVPDFIVMGTLDSFWWRVYPNLKRSQLHAFEKWCACIAQSLKNQTIGETEITGARARITYTKDV